MSRRVRGTKSHAAAANERVAGVRRLPSNTGRQRNEHQHREEMPLRPLEHVETESAAALPDAGEDTEKPIAPWLGVNRAAAALENRALSDLIF